MLGHHIGSYAVEASVPNWFVEKLDPNQHVAHNYIVFPTLDRLDTQLLATMQCANVRVLRHATQRIAREFVPEARIIRDAMGNALQGGDSVTVPVIKDLKTVGNVLQDGDTVTVIKDLKIKD